MLDDALECCLLTGIEQPRCLFCSSTIVNVVLVWVDDETQVFQMVEVENQPFRWRV